MVAGGGRWQVAVAAPTQQSAKEALVVEMVVVTFALVVVVMVMIVVMVVVVVMVLPMLLANLRVVAVNMSGEVIRSFSDLPMSRTSGC